MADNFSFTEGAGKTGAADDVSGVLYPRIKLSQGADGSATDVSSAAPLQVTLANTGANATAVKTDSSATTQPVSGSVAVTQSTGTNLHTVVDSGTITTVGAAASGATKSGNPVQIGAVYNSTPPTLGTGQIVEAQATQRGSLVVATGIDSFNVSAGVQTLNGSVVDTNSGLKSSGTLRVVLATDQPALTNKLLVTPDSVALPANQSVNVNQINAVTPLMGNGVTGTGSQRVTIASDNTAFSVNANAGTNLNTSALALETGGNLASIKTDVDNLNLAQGSTTSGQKGNLTLGAVTTGSPTYTTAQSSPLSLDTTGALRVNVTAGGSGGGIVTQATAANLNATVVGTGTFAVQASAGTNLNTSALALDATLTGGTAQTKITDGTNVATVKAASTAPVLTDKAVVTTQRDPLPAGTNVIGHAIIDTGSTTAVTQATAANLNATIVGTGTFVTQSTLAAETTKVIGTVNVAASQTIALAAGSAVIGHVIADSGSTTAVTALPAIPSGTNTIGSVKLTDGTTVPNVKAASTAAIATDPALVVAISPNNTVPVSIASLPSGAVTNAGTFAVQATPVTQADTFMLGGVNVKEINAVTPLMGNGVTGTGSQRVTIASDNTPFSVNATTVPGTTGGLSTFHLVSAATTNLTNIKASAGQYSGGTSTIQMPQPEKSHSTTRQELQPQAQASLWLWSFRQAEPRT